jgi:hypothetical protein
MSIQIVQVSVINDAAFRFGMPFPPKLEDVSYVPLDLDWLMGREAGNYIISEIRKRVGKFVDEESDCDDFAKCAIEIVKELHRSTPDRPKNCAPLIGYWTFFQVPSTKKFAHAINIVGYRRKGQLMFQAIEPQSWSRITLTSAQKTACRNYEF